MTVPGVRRPIPRWRFGGLLGVASLQAQPKAGLARPEIDFPPSSRRDARQMIQRMLTCSGPMIRTVLLLITTVPKIGSRPSNFVKQRAVRERLAGHPSGQREVLELIAVKFRPFCPECNKSRPLSHSPDLS